MHLNIFIRKICSNFWNHVVVSLQSFLEKSRIDHRDHCWIPVLKRTKYRYCDRQIFACGSLKLEFSSPVRFPLTSDTSDFLAVTNHSDESVEARSLSNIGEWYRPPCTVCQREQVEAFKNSRYVNYDSGAISKRDSPSRVLSQRDSVKCIASMLSVTLPV